MRSCIARILTLLPLLALVPLASCRDAAAVTVDDFAAHVAGDSLRLTASFHLDPSIDSAAAVFTVKGVSKRVKLAPSTTGAIASFPLPAEREMVSPQLVLTLWKQGTAPVSATRTISYTQPVIPIVPPVIDGFTAEQAAAFLLDSTRVKAYLTALAPSPCHAEVRDYVTGTLFIPPQAERPGCDATVVRLGWYAMMDSTGRGTAPALSLGAWNAGQLARGRAQSAAVRAGWVLVPPERPARITITDAACCPPLWHDWPAPVDPPAMTVSIWRGA